MCSVVFLLECNIIEVGHYLKVEGKIKIDWNYEKTYLFDNSSYADSANAGFSSDKLLPIEIYYHL